MPRFLPDDWKGAFVLLLIVGVISSFLDNIAAVLIGGTIAQQVFRGKVLANVYPDAKSAGRWLLGGWHVTVAYAVGFFVLLTVLGWHPDPRTGSAWICGQRRFARWQQSSTSLRDTWASSTWASQMALPAAARAASQSLRSAAMAQATV